MALLVQEQPYNNIYINIHMREKEKVEHKSGPFKVN